MLGLSPLQKRVFNFIVEYMDDNEGTSPTYSEIQNALEIKHHNTVKGVLIGLEKKRYIEREWASRRGINLIYLHKKID